MIIYVFSRTPTKKFSRRPILWFWSHAGIKGATDQMLSWKAPNDPKTLPMGILHYHKSFWPPMGPFGYPPGAQTGPFGPGTEPNWKKSFWAPQRSQIWSQLPPIGPTELDSWSTHTLTWYRAPSEPQGALKGLVLAPKGPFGGPQGPWRAPVGQIWSQLPSNGLMGLNLWSPHTLTWYQAPWGSPGAQKGLFWPNP